MDFDAKRPRPSILLGAQYLAEGSGGIGGVARMTAAALGRRHALSAMACMEPADFRIGDAAVRAFRGSRVRFVAGLAREALRSTHVVYDFAGTARAQKLPLLRGLPSAIWVHGWEVWDAPRPDYIRALERADLVLVNSAYTLERAGSALKGVKTVRVCPLATSSDEIPAVTGPSEGPPVVLLLGRIDQLLAKGHEILISIWPKVASAVPGARLVFAGGGEAVGHVRALAAASPAAASIEVTGFVPAENVEALWRRATVFAMPAFGEGFGLVYIEAMRQGIPVIASLEDAGQEINSEGITGFNISRNSQGGIANAVIALLRDRDLCRKFGAAGHARWKDSYRFSSFEARLAAATADFLSA